MNLIKKQALGAYITIAAIVIALIALIVYGATLNAGNNVQTANGGEIYLVKSDFGPVTTVGVLGLVFLVLGLLISNIELKGIVGTVVNMLGTAFRIVAPALIILATVRFIEGSLTGLGWTFFSNEELEINPVAIHAGKLNIAAIALYLVSAITALVAVFFPVLKKED